VREACERGLQAQFYNYRLQTGAGLTASVETLVIAQDLGCAVTDAFINSAAGAGHVNVLVFLHDTQGVQLPAQLSIHAAANTRIDVLRWLQCSDIAFDEQTAVVAAAGAHIDVLQYLLSAHTEFTLDKSLCRAAALAGQLQTLQYLREAGCP
jgi:hypothetical protein